MTSKICSVEPKRAEVFENGFIYTMPCGVKYVVKGDNEPPEIHCKKHEERTCEYMMLKYMKDDDNMKDNEVDFSC